MRPAAQGRPTGPRAVLPYGIAAREPRTRAVCAQLRKVALLPPEQCCPTGSRLGCQSKSGMRPAAQGRLTGPRAVLPYGIAAREPRTRAVCAQLRKVAHGPRAVLPYGIAAREPRTRAVCAQLRKVALMAPEQCCPAGSRLGSQGQERYATSCARLHED
jgi:hypothetical protein